MPDEVPPGGQAYACGGNPGDRWADVTAANGFATLSAVGGTALSCRVKGWPHHELCDAEHARVVVYGILGRHARALTYDGRRIPLGRDGAYMLVTAGIDHPTGKLRVTWDDGSTAVGSADPDARTMFLPKPPKGRAS